MPHPAQVEREHGQDDDLVAERLGAGDADFGAGVKIDAAVGLAGDAAADHVAQGQRRMSLALRFAQGGQGVGGFARLRDGQHDRVAVDGRIAIAKLRGVFHFDRNAGEFLEEIFADQGGVIAGAARRQDEAIGTAELLRIEVEAAEVGRGILIARAGHAWRCPGLRAARKSP